MGVTNLLSFTASASSEAHVSQFKGGVLAVDASCWLHRGACACADELVLRGADSLTHEKYLGFALKMIRMLMQHGVTPLLVFDGGTLPLKEPTNRARRERREAEVARGRYEGAISVTSHMARRLIAHLRRQRLPYLVAPYEADAQIAYLVRRGHCAAAITEDSDLLAHKCPATLYKLDVTGHGRLILYDNLRFAESAPGRLLFDGAWVGEWDAWAQHLFISMCILAGTDYLVGGIHGVGLKTAHSLLRKHKSLEAALGAHLHLAPNGEAIRSLMEHINRVRQAFDTPRIFDPSSERVVMIGGGGEAATVGEALDTAHLGMPMEHNLARAVCLHASVDPITLEDVTNLDPSLPPPVPLPPATVHPAAAPPSQQHQAQQQTQSVQQSRFFAAAALGAAVEPTPPPSQRRPMIEGLNDRCSGADREEPVARSPLREQQQQQSPQTGPPSNVPLCPVMWIDLRWREEGMRPSDAPPPERRPGVALSRAPTTSACFLDRFRV